MSDIKTLTGVAASSLMVRGLRLEIAAFLCVLPIVFESALPGSPWFWGGGFVVVGLVLLAVGLIQTSRSAARTKQERALGYTTVWKVARQDMTLGYIDARDGQMISGPGQSRPPTSRRADIQAAKAKAL